MTVSALQFSAAGKAVWGRAILTALLAMLLLPAAPVEASGQPPGHQRQTESAAVKQARAARIARRHAKLDLRLSALLAEATKQQTIEAAAERAVIIDLPAFIGKRDAR